ncbi:MAG: DUF2332 family protein [Rhodobacteraceae bacterium]|nr:DUF2332 family protein [Paracoccaceae bacterium]
MSLPEALRVQAGACGMLGSPFTERLLLILAERLRPGTPLTDRLFGWPGDIGPYGASVPLRLAGALHALVLSGTAPALAACYPPHDVTDETLWTAVEAALKTHAARIDAFLDSAPQTNEVRRSAVLIAIGHWLDARFGLPLILSELGASAGLNLNWDRFALKLPGQTLGPEGAGLVLTPEWRGTAPVPANPQVAERRGVDLAPFDLNRPEDALRLRSYIWADQADRHALTDAALAEPPAPVDRADAADWIAARLEKPRTGHAHLIYNTVAWQYFPDEKQAQGLAAIEKAGAAATTNAPIAWFGMETDGNAQGAALTLRLWPGDLTLEMGRADFHGRWVDWQAPPPDHGADA